MLSWRPLRGLCRMFHHASHLAALVVLALVQGGCLRPFDPLATADGDVTPMVDAGGGQVVTLPPDKVDMAIGGDRSGRAVFNANVKPMMDPRCGPCHGQIGGIGPSFMKGDPYDTIVAYPGMI